jgi:hypothetical protein
MPAIGVEADGRRTWPALGLTIAPALLGRADEMIDEDADGWQKALAAKPSTGVAHQMAIFRQRIICRLMLRDAERHAGVLISQAPRMPRRTPRAGSPATCSATPDEANVRSR